MFLYEVVSLTLASLFLVSCIVTILHLWAVAVVYDD